jgi:hypothetical protein
MKNLLVLAMLAMLIIGCGETDAPLTPEPEQSLPEPEQSVPVIETPPAPERDTTVLQLVSYRTRWLNRWTPEQDREHHFILPNGKVERLETFISAGTATETWIVDKGLLTKREIISQKEIYEFIWCFLDDRLALVNILDNQIPYVSDEAEIEHLDQKNDEWNKLFDELWDKHKDNPEIDV